MVLLEGLWGDDGDTNDEKSMRESGAALEQHTRMAQQVGAPLGASCVHCLLRMARGCTRPGQLQVAGRQQAHRFPGAREFECLHA